MASTTALDQLLRRDRAIVIGALIGVIAAAWLYLLMGARMDMDAMRDMTMPISGPTWSPAYFTIMFVMWASMMLAMMLPSAAPMILLYATVTRRREQARALVGVGAFALGYVAVWTVFSLAATLLQWGLDAATLLSPMMKTTSVAVAGLALAAAGAYQWTPLKQACLRKCQSPLHFVLGNWREGGRGAFAMGLRHGSFCIGCCWLIMLLLFVGGVMNLVWIAGLALYVLVEKLWHGEWVARAAGVVLAAWGSATLWTLF